MGKGGIAPLQKADHRIDGGLIAIEMVEKMADGFGFLLFRRQGKQQLADLAEAIAAEQFEHQRQRQIGLHRIHPSAAQKAGEVGGGGVGGVELGHGRDQRQYLERGYSALCCCHRYYPRAALPALLPDGAAGRNIGVLCQLRWRHMRLRRLLLIAVAWWLPLRGQIAAAPQ